MKRITISLILTILGYFLAQFLIGQTYAGDEMTLHWSLLIYSAVLIPPIFYLFLGGKGLFVGAVIACVYNLIDILIIQNMFGDSLPQTLTSTPNVFGVGPINGIYFIAGLIALGMHLTRK